MIPIDEALRRIQKNLPAPVIESLDFRSAHGRVLAEGLTATGDIPPFNKSAVDGYAVRCAGGGFFRTFFEEEISKTTAEIRSAED